MTVQLDTAQDLEKQDMIGAGEERGGGGGGGGGDKGRGGFGRGRGGGGLWIGG